MVSSVSFHRYVSTCPALISLAFCEVGTNELAESFAKVQHFFYNLNIYRENLCSDKIQWLFSCFSFASKQKSWAIVNCPTLKQMVVMFINRYLINSLWILSAMACISSAGRFSFSLLKFMSFSLCIGTRWMWA